uniref:Zn(2)-C6 fungal-type domain-containing protein n=1 Tax=Bionectria ochroleuca TaxID=29856 RepID=A0A8H7KEV8_BIOOC
MYSSPDENSSKRRKVRKGTRSCWECRRRKVKCTFESPQDVICITCHRRGAKCASQRDFDDTNLSSRPAEGKEPPDSLDNTPTKSPGASRPVIRDASGICTPSISLSESSTPAFPQHAGSVHSIGNGRQGEWPKQLRKVSELQSTTSPNTHESITRELLRALPSENDIKILTGKITKAPLLCHQSFYKESSQEVLDEQCSLPNLLYPEEHPVLLASQMLLFSLAIQSWSPNDVPSGLSKHPHVIMEELAESAIKLVTTNDALLGTLESLENIMFEGMYHVDRGNIRRSWVTLRRAVTVAQLLGIHLPGHHRFKLLKTKSNLDPQAIWDCTVWMERLLSLLLGLPSCTLGMESAHQDTTSASTKSLEFPPTLTDLIAKVLERNQVNTLEKSVELTRGINKELIRIAEIMPLRFWRPPAYDGMKANSQEAFAETKRILEHMRYYTLLNQLHLPHMLCPNTSFESTCSKIACVNASREILIRQIAIRNFNPISACLRMGDFMALIAA